MGVLNSRMRSGSVIIFMTMLLSCLAISALAADDAQTANDAAAADADDPVVLARENFAQGQAAYEAKDFEAADMHFSKAYELKPHPSALKMIAECKLQLGQLPEAVTIMETLLQDSGYDKKNKLKRRLVKIKKKVGTLHVESTPAGAVVSLNGQILDEKTPVTVYVNPGPQKVVLLMENYEEQSREVKVAAKKEVTISVDYNTLTPIAAPGRDLIDPFAEDDEAAEAPSDEAVAESDEAEKSPPVVEEPKDETVASIDTAAEEPPKAFWAAAAIAGVGVVSGTVFGTMALRDEKDFKDTGDEATRDSGRRSAVIADISFGVAICAAVAGTIILIRHKNKKDAASAADEQARFFIRPQAGAKEMGLTSGFSF